MSRDVRTHIPVRLLQEDDGRWIGEVEVIPGVVAYGDSQRAAFMATIRLCMEVLNERLELGEPTGIPDIDQDSGTEGIAFDRELAGC